MLKPSQTLDPDRLELEMYPGIECLDLSKGIGFDAGGLTGAICSGLKVLLQQRESERSRLNFNSHSRRVAIFG
jgi:hypothetical protein